MRLTAPRTAKIAGVLTAGLAGLALAGSAVAASASADPSPQFHVTQILNGKSLHHTFVPSGSTASKTDPLSGPDDITAFGSHLFVSFQNGVGAQGEPSSDGNTHSTVVGFTAGGRVIGQWDLVGKCDGLTADPALGELIATVNEDAKSSIYTIKPFGQPGQQVQHYAYNEPLPHFGGTDAITIYQGHVLVSASAPGTAGTPTTAPAVYSVTFDRATHVATVTPVFNDTDPAALANVGPTEGQVSPLALTDPDSSEVVAQAAPRFAGDFMLDSQGDLQEIFLHRAYGSSKVTLSVLNLQVSIDDSAWATSPSGRLFGADASSDTVDMVTGTFRPGSMFVAATPCNANAAPATCPAPGFPANYLGSENMWTGAITPVTLTGPGFRPHSLIFVRG